MYRPIITQSMASNGLKLIELCEIFDIVLFSFVCFKRYSFFYYFELFSVNQLNFNDTQTESEIFKIQIDDAVFFIRRLIYAEKKCVLIFIQPIRQERNVTF